MKALIVVDIQNDFCPGGALAVEGGDETVAPANILIKKFEATELPLVFTRDWHPDNHCSFSDFGGIWPVHCVAGTEGADFHGELHIPEGSLIIPKADSQDRDAYSGFEGTGLDARLRELDVDSIIIAGLATDYCVKNTVLDALRLGYRTTVASDCIRAVEVNPGDGDAAIEEMKAAGAVFKVSDSIDI